MDEKKIRTVSALLAKANDASATEEEAALYTAKATELMIKYGIDAAQLNVGKLITEKITQFKFTYTGTYAPEQLRLTYWIGTALGLQGYVSNDGTKGKVMYLVGYESDVDLARLLAGSLQIQCASATAAYMDSRRNDYGWTALTAGQKYKIKRGFILGFADRVADRIKQTRKQVIAESGGGAEIALVAREDQVKKWLVDAVPDLKAKKSNRKDNVSAMSAGQLAGDKADIGGVKVTSGGAKEIGA